MNKHREPRYKLLPAAVEETLKLYHGWLGYLLTLVKADTLRVKAKARSRMQEQDATVYPGESGVCRVVFDEPQRALTPGQAVVLYDGDTVLGGGIIREVLK